MSLFEKHRIVFWYDAKCELRASFEALDLEGVEKCEICNNEYALKYRLLREAPQQKFLLYHEGPQPTDIENWLLDILLAHAEFKADQVSLYLSDLALGSDLAETIRQHHSFFAEAKRKDRLKAMLEENDSAYNIRLKMLAVCVGSEPRIDSIVEALLQALSKEDERKFSLIQYCQLEAFLWELLQREYAYTAKTPSLLDFVFELFTSCYAMEVEGESHLSADALVLLKRWKDSRSLADSFEQLSQRYADEFHIEQRIATQDIRDLVSVDYFRVIDEKITQEIKQALVQRSLSAQDVVTWVRQRQTSRWYSEFQYHYQLLEAAAKFFQASNDTSLSMDSLVDGIQRYADKGYRLDLYYRQFIYAMMRLEDSTWAQDLYETIENIYVNDYVPTLNQYFQHYVDKTTQWRAYPIVGQSQFFAHYVQPFLNKGNKVCVIISDALRYEIGAELADLIAQENRMTAHIDPMLSALPSYTQLGMASLLPHRALEIMSNDTATVMVDAQSSQGRDNRHQILQTALNGRGSAYRYDEVINFNREELREVLRNNDVVYIYHNRIDAVGDKQISERQVFTAVHETLEAMLKLVKKLTNASVSNILLTADHGFLYQHRDLDKSDYTEVDATGEKIWIKNRRYVIGKGLEDSPSLCKFSAQALGLQGDYEVQIPKTVNRLRLQGSGSAFVHGGATLQEVVVPVLKINKGRQDDVSLVDVDILSGASQVITLAQLAVRFYQHTVVTPKCQPRYLRVGLYTLRGEVISDQHELVFDLTSENPRDREVQVQLMLTQKADRANNQEVILRVDEKLPGTSQYREYKSIRYTIRRTFSTDFDF